MRGKRGAILSLVIIVVLATMLFCGFAFVPGAAVSWAAQDPTPGEPMSTTITMTIGDLESILVAVMDHDLEMYEIGLEKVVAVSDAGDKAQTTMSIGHSVSNAAQGFGLLGGAVVGILIMSGVIKTSAARQAKR